MTTIAFKPPGIPWARLSITVFRKGDVYGVEKDVTQTGPHFGSWMNEMQDAW